MWFDCVVSTRNLQTLYVRIQDGVIVRALVPQDIAAWKALDAELFPVQYEPTFYLQFFSSEENKHDYVVLGAFEEESGTMIGVISARRSLQRTGLFSHASKCYIMTIGVHALYRRKRIAHILMQIVQTWFERWTTCTSVFLHVLSTNMGALRFYENLHFRTACFRKGFYEIQGRPMDALELEKPLMPSNPLNWTNWFMSFLPVHWCVAEDL
eukprot:ANDGO_08239.mRNA.1 putative N-acetyltransferase san